MEFLIIAVIVAVVGFGIYYVFQDAKERGDEWKEKEFSVVGKLLLMLNVLLTFAGAGLTVYGFLDGGTWGVVGIFLWIICATISAYVTSPLRLFIVPTNVDSGNGCAYMIYMPLMLVVMLVSVVLVMAISWVYALMAIFRRANKWITAIALVLLAALLAAPFVVQRVQYRQAALEEQRREQEEAAKQEEEEELTAAIVEKVRSGMETGVVQELELTDAEKSFLRATEQSAFTMKEVRREVAYKLSELCGEKDAAGIVELAGYLACNGALNTSENKNGVNICFTSGFLKLIREEAMQNGTFKEEGAVCDIYSYRGHEVWIDRNNRFVSIYATPGDVYSVVMFSNVTYMNEMIKTYNDDIVDYYSVGNTVEFKTVTASNTGTSTTTKKGNCSRCSGTGKVTKHYGNSWNKKPGYVYGQKCGACNGTGWTY